ncbi:MAG: ATP-binding cassette domain-containing protein, partial [Candidatus Bathyarchaeota archaeon]
FQDPTLDLELTGRENLDFHGRLYSLGRAVRKQRIKEMLDLVQLADRADDFVKTYSGGMKRRLEIARGLLHHPRILFLDEPTLGLDPQTRRSIWGHIQRLNEEKNITIILTTHYTEEADYLCENILIIDFGKIVALDTPNNLKARLEGDIVSLAFKDPAEILKTRPLFEEKNWVRSINVVASGSSHATMSHMMQMMRGMSSGAGGGGMMPGMGSGSVGGSGKMPKHARQMLAQGRGGEDAHSGFDGGPKRLNLLVDDGGHRIPEIVKLTDASGVILESVELHKPTLDDVFLSVTGRNIRDEQGSFIETVRRHRTIRQARGQRVKG